MTFSPRSVALGLLAGLAVAAPARADLVVLSSGRVISAARVTLSGGTATITLRGGGEVTCDRSLIVRVDPDEVPWVDPKPAGDPAAPAAAVAEAPQPAAAPRPVEIPAAYKPLITRLADQHGVDARLIHAVISVESSYQPRARSRKGARGLMQIMPATGRQYGVRKNSLYTASANLDAGVRHLKGLLTRFGLREALAAYNAGEAAVRRFGGVPPFRETRNYVDKVLQLSGLEPAPAPEPPPSPDPPALDPATPDPTVPADVPSGRSGS
jgi:soluble lytic murein transglycosylase-like protein